jgi:hypothetical protein
LQCCTFRRYWRWHCCSLFYCYCVSGDRREKVAAKKPNVQGDQKVAVHLSLLPHYLAQSDCLAADRQDQGDTILTLTLSVIPNSNYVIMVSDWNSLKYFCVFLYCNHQVHRDFLITLYYEPRNCLYQTILKQPHYRPRPAMRVPEGWGSQILRQSAYEGGKVVSLKHRLPLPHSWYLCYRLSQWKTQWHHRESNPWPSRLKRSATTKCAIARLTKLFYDPQIKVIRNKTRT